MEFIKPGPNKRVCAFLVDMIAISLICEMFRAMMTIKIDWAISLVLFLVKDCFNGQSLGKYLVGTQIIDENKEVVEPFKAIIRNIFIALPFFPFIEYIVMLNDKQDGKRLGDRIAKTKVTDLKPQMEDMTFLWISIALIVLFGVLVRVLAPHPPSTLPG